MIFENVNWVLAEDEVELKQSDFCSFQEIELAVGIERVGVIIMHLTGAAG